METRRWTPEIVEFLLNTNDKAVERAVLRLWEFQTSEEKASQKALSRNGQGLNATDSTYMRRFALFIQRGNSLDTKGLRFLRGNRRIQKYSKQLAEFANKRISALEAELRAIKANQMAMECSDDRCYTYGRINETLSDRVRVEGLLRKAQPSEALLKKYEASQPIPANPD